MRRRRRGLLAIVLLVACARQPAYEEGREYRDADGTPFTVQRIAKAAAAWHRVDAHTIRVHPFRTYRVAREDPDAFFVKIYRAVHPSAIVPTAVPPSDHVVLAETRRFLLEDTGDGLPRAGQWRQAFDLGDLDGDGHLDLAHGPRRKRPGPPIIFRGNGAGGFAPWREARFPSLPYDYGAVALADFNRDGKMDVALAAHMRGLTVLTGDGSGGFAPFADGLVMRAGGAPGSDDRISSRALAVVDWTGDGAPDLVALADGPVRTAGPRVTRRYGRGMWVLARAGGQWVPLARTDDRDPVFGDALAVGDLDGDGIPEVVTATHALGFTRLVRRRTRDGWASEELAGLRSGALVHAVATGDFDRDGRDEVAIGYLTAENGIWRTGIDLLSARAGAVERRPVSAEDSRRGIASLATGDLDGDAAPDLVALGGDGSVETFAGDGRGFLTRDTRIAVPQWRRGCAGSHVRIADLDHDGRAEIVASFAGERAGLDLAREPVCPSGGGFQAWRTVQPAAAGGAP